MINYNVYFIINYLYYHLQHIKHFLALYLGFNLVSAPIQIVNAFIYYVKRIYDIKIGFKKIIQKEILLSYDLVKISDIDSKTKLT